MIDKREMQFLYRDGDDYVFMDNESYEQLHVAPVGARPTPPTTSSTAPPSSLQMYGDEIVGSDLPAAVELNVTETEPGVQGDRVSGARKPATLETGLVRAGAAVREPGRPHQGRHPHRRVHHPGLGVSLADRAARRARARPRPALRGRDQGHHGRRGARRPAGRPRTTSPTALVTAVDEHRRPHRRPPRSASPRAGPLSRMPALDRAALRMGDRRADHPARRAHRRGPRRRRSSWPRASRPTTPAASSTASWRGSRWRCAAAMRRRRSPPFSRSRRRTTRPPSSRSSTRSSSTSTASSGTGIRPTARRPTRAWACPRARSPRWPSRRTAWPAPWMAGSRSRRGARRSAPSWPSTMAPTLSLPPRPGPPRRGGSTSMCSTWWRPFGRWCPSRCCRTPAPGSRSTSSAAASPTTSTQS